MSAVVREHPTVDPELVSNLRETNMTFAGEGPTPTAFARDDGRCLLYPGTNDLHGAPGIGKTLLLDVAIAQQLNAGCNAVVIDYEDPNGSTHKERLRAFGITDDIINDRRRFRHIVPEGLIRSDIERRELEETLIEMSPAFWAIDAMGGALTMQSLNENDNRDYFHWRQTIGEPLAFAAGQPGWLLDHVSRDKERTRGARGAGAKLQGLTGASYELLPVKFFSREQAGTVKLVIAKDRHGHVGPIGTTAALIDITPSDGGQHIDITIRPGDTATTTEDDSNTFRPTLLMERVSRQLEHLTDTNNLPSRDALARSVSGRHIWLLRAIDALIEEGHVIRDGRKLRSVFPFRKDAT